MALKVSEVRNGDSIKMKASKLINITAQNFFRGVIIILPSAYLSSLFRIFLENYWSRNRSSLLNEIIFCVGGKDLSPKESEAFLSLSTNSIRPENISTETLNFIEQMSGGILHYSQEGEDVILERLLGSHKTGFYVDIGAHHPTRFSNTFALYRKGWRGINIDATPGSMKLFNQLRPDDTNLEIAVSNRLGPLVLSTFHESALNTLHPDLSKEYIESGWSSSGNVELIPQKLSYILDAHLEIGQKINLLSIDVEGEDLEVLESNDWDKYSPEIIIIEVLNLSFERLDSDPSVIFLKGKGFFPVSKLFNSVILRKS